MKLFLRRLLYIRFYLHQFTAASFFNSINPIATVGISNNTSAICAIHSILGILLAEKAIVQMHNKIATHAATVFVRNKIMPKISRLNGNNGPVAKNNNCDEK